MRAPPVQTQQDAQSRALTRCRRHIQLVLDRLELGSVAQRIDHPVAFHDQERGVMQLLCFFEPLQTLLDFCSLRVNFRVVVRGGISGYAHQL